MRTLNPEQILYTADALNARGEAILAHYSEATQHEVAQHNRLPALDVAHYKAKSDLLVLGRLKTLQCKDSFRSADYIAPSLANGCYAGCAYCYVDRHKAINPITLFTNTEQILAAVDQHVHQQVWPKVPNQTDPTYYTYDIGCNSDVSFDATLSDSVARAIDFFREHPRAKATFATKFVNRDLLTLDPRGKTRVRFSLMPAAVSKLVDVRTDPIAQRLAAINDFYDAGYEVHVNFSPVIVYGGKQWRDDYRELFRQLDDALRPEVRAQLQCEVIFLTHNRGQHETNVGINPRAEELLWVPEMQETKRSQFGSYNIRYQRHLKARMIDVFKQLIDETIPWCRIRYIF